ncbi:MAG: hypothetical protein NVSMB49_05250 [Ktedonobacteraceae bacterium]
MMWGYDFGWGGMSLMILGMTLGIALLVILVWVLLTWLNKKASVAVAPAPHFPPSGPSAGEILQQRYARGEIDATTFEQMGERLEASDSAHQRSWVEVRRPVGEKLFDGRTRGTKIL